MKRMLLIEDDEEFSRWVRTCMAGIEIVSVSSWEQAVPMIQAVGFDLVVCDIGCLQPFNRCMCLLRTYQPRAALVGVTGSQAYIPDEFDAADYKINVAGKTCAFQNLVFTALRNRDRTPMLERNLRSIESLACLLPYRVATA